MRKRISEYTLYRWRYAIGYTLAALIVTPVLLFTALYIPGGLRAAERTSAIMSGSLVYTNFDPQTVVNLPYHILQRAGFALFGVDEFMIKLPSIICGFFAVIGIFLLIREWFHINTAVITTLLSATLPLFLFMAQDGTPTIYPVALSIWLLVSGTYITRAKRPQMLWKIMFFVLFALNLYAPLGLYLNLAVISTMIFHPHIRYAARKLSLNKIIIGCAVGLIILTPLLYSVAMHPRIGLDLLGIPSTLPSIKENLIALGTALFGAMTIGSSAIAQPILSLGILLIIIIGAVKFIQIKYTARSYITWFWALTLTPLIVLNPEHVGLAFPLIVLMIAMGIGYLISSWYKMFPRNPYARITGLVPLTFIVVGIVSSSVVRYAISYHYAPSITHHFDSDVRLLKRAVAAADTYTDSKVTVVVPQDRIAFYELLARYDGTFTASSSSTVPSPLIISRDHADRKSLTLQPTLVFTDRSNNDADRFYLYTSKQQ